MANLFEKPIAANPMSTFAQMPLQYMQASLDRRTKQYYDSKAEVEAQENSLLGLKYLSGDAQRHHELQQQFSDELEQIVENADGDYSNIQHAMDGFTRKLKQEVNYGELAAQQGAYASAMKMKEIEGKKLSDGKSSEEGYAKFMDSISRHQTKNNLDGTFSQFQGYSSSTINNPLKRIQDGVDEVVKNWDEDGMETRTPDRVISNIMNQISGDTGLQKALSERIYGKVDADGNPLKFGDYVQNLVKGVVSDKAYYEKATMKDQYGNNMAKMPGMVLKNVGMPNNPTGDTGYTGGSSPILKDFTAILGRDSWKEHKSSIASENVQRRIKYIEGKTGDSFPQEDITAQREWLEKYATGGLTGEVTAKGPSKAEMLLINSRGQLNNTDAAITDMQGNRLKADEVRAIQGTSKDQDGGNKVSYVSGVVTSGGMHPPGTVVMTSHNGENYFIEPSDPLIINSPDYSSKLINMASSTKTGKLHTTTRAAIGDIPPGSYEVEHVPMLNSNGRLDYSSQTYNLYQNGKLKYRKFTRPDGSTWGKAVDNPKKD